MQMAMITIISRIHHQPSGGITAKKHQTRASCVIVPVLTIPTTTIVLITNRHHDDHHHYHYDHDHDG